MSNKSSEKSSEHYPSLRMNNDRCVTFTNGVTVQYAPSECVDALLEKLREVNKPTSASPQKSTR